MLKVSVAATASGNLKAEATENLLVRRGQLEVEVLDRRSSSPVRARLTKYG